ncbi:MAG: hypothetical protein KKH09_06280 [Proteobacteria bacterium]|nr:hypothetical protein [Pseudomonadota bacterium]
MEFMKTISLVVKTIYYCQSIFNHGTKPCTFFGPEKHPGIQGGGGTPILPIVVHFLEMSLKNQDFAGEEPKFIDEI